MIKTNMKKILAFLLVCIMLTMTSCSIIGEITGMFGNENPENPPAESEDNEVVDDHVHKPVYVKSSLAGYATHGNKAYYKCECGKIFSDAGGKREITLSSVTLRSDTGFDKQTYIDNGYILNYCLYEPADLDKESDKRPLILFLHGAGERGSNNEWQIKNAILKVNKTGKWAESVIIAPQCPSSTGGNTNSDVNDPNKWVETPWTEGNYVQSNVPESKPLHAVAELIKEYSSYDYIDSSRIYVVGLSMGGFGTWDIISRYPELFAAAVPICGGGPTDKIDVLKNIPIYTFHGTKDTAVPYASTEGMYNAIVAAGGNNIIFYTYTGPGHNIWDKAITFAGDGASYPALETWLFSQVKK